ncbi:hypothetical protein ACFL2R_01205 [Patescibacteria group bacterium]
MTKRNVGSTNYAKGTVALDYNCDQCGALGVKLWREYQTFADCTELLCADCAAKDQNEDISTMQSDGRYMGKYGMSDQIGGMMPAVPVEDEDTYWGYTSVPPEGCVWWRNLPNRMK